MKQKKKLDEKLQKFFAEIRKKAGSEYEPVKVIAGFIWSDTWAKTAGKSWKEKQGLLHQQGFG